MRAKKMCQDGSAEFISTSFNIDVLESLSHQKTACLPPVTAQNFALDTASMRTLAYAALSALRLTR